MGEQRLPQAGFRRQHNLPAPARGMWIIGIQVDKRQDFYLCDEEGAVLRVGTLSSKAGPGSCSRDESSFLIPLKEEVYMDSGMRFHIMSNCDRRDETRRDETGTRYPCLYFPRSFRARHLSRMTFSANQRWNHSSIKALTATLSVWFGSVGLKSPFTSASLCPSLRYSMS